ncbi:hypothetical protein GGR54DRAFT_614067 [Hypoxylon sp. NC1633]|nr:hypothetical protein GGR54DRAFT_614067 [Hypoxylon sp. NC1633]
MKPTSAHSSDNQVLNAKDEIPRTLQLSAMSIQQLPDHVIAQIKSSTTITSLNSVLCGLVKNSLDAQATKITVSVDYVRGNCSVEDNGSGIPPNEFRSAGGLGKLHYTSRFPPCYDNHGRLGTFLASVASLSLLSITSHHHKFHSHNSIRIHNSEILARHIPSLPEQRLLSFPHGTRVTVRDLFGSMPVRVKQRAIDAERGVNAKNWERLKRALVALLLAWPGQVSISLRDSAEQRNLTIRTPEESSSRSDETQYILGLTTRVSRTLFQAQLADDRSRDLWVPLKASAGQLSVTGAVSLLPIASRQVQFISIGVRPVSNEHGSNVLYDEINQLFAKSSFGVEEEGGNLSENEKNRRAKDRRYKSDGYTDQELQGRKGVDRWPMFYIEINLGMQTPRFAEFDVEGILDERNESLTAIVDILTAVVYEFLRTHHFRPKYSKYRVNIPSRPSATRTRQSKSLSRSSTPRTESGPNRGCVSRSQSGDLASTRLSFASKTSSVRPESLFDSWARIKSGQPQYVHLHEKSSGHQNTAGSDPNETRPLSTRAPPDGDADMSNTPLVAADGTLLRIPFPDVEKDIHETSQKPASGKSSVTDEQLQVYEGEEMLWTNSMTKERFAVNARTGLVIRPLSNNVRASGEPGDTYRPSLRKRIRTSTKPVHRDERSEWLGDLLSSWDNPVFQPQEPPIPVALDEAKALALARPSEGHYHGCDHQSLDSLQASYSVEGRLSKRNLRNAMVIAQVDRKFILAKIPLFSSSAERDEGKKPGPHSLVIIDQHAADERCRVEALMENYFVGMEGGQGVPMRLSQQPFRVHTELLEKPIVFDISAHDCRQFERSAEFFENWGIVYQVKSLPESKRTGQRAAELYVLKLPPSIAERCRIEPRLLIELLRKEAWKLDEQGHSTSQRMTTETVPEDGENPAGLHWLARFHGCPQGILEMINSRACRSSIMFNDYLSLAECSDLVRRLADCALPFQCAHGRPSMVPLVDLGISPIKETYVEKPTSTFGQDFRRWKSSMKSQETSAHT